MGAGYNCFTVLMGEINGVMVVMTVGGGVGEVEQWEGDQPQKLNIEPCGLNIGVGCNCSMVLMGETTGMGGGWWL
jgi:hypothetical protein